MGNDNWVLSLPMTYLAGPTNSTRFLPAMAAEPLLFLTGHVSTIFPPVQAMKKIWHQELIISITARDQPAEGLVKIQFAEENMSLLDGLRLGEYVTVGFTVRGVRYYWEGATKYLVVLMGQQVKIAPEPGPRKKSGGRPGPGPVASDFSNTPISVPVPQNHAFDDALPF